MDSPFRHPAANAVSPFSPPSISDTERERRSEIEKEVTHLFKHTLFFIDHMRCYNDKQIEQYGSGAIDSIHTISTRYTTKYGSLPDELKKLLEDIKKSVRDYASPRNKPNHDPNSADGTAGSADGTAGSAMAATSSAMATGSAVASRSGVIAECEMVTSSAMATGSAVASRSGMIDECEMASSSAMATGSPAYCGFPNSVGATYPTVVVAQPPTFITENENKIDTSVPSKRIRRTKLELKTLGIGDPTTFRKKKLKEKERMLMEKMSEMGANQFEIDENIQQLRKEHLNYGGKKF